MKKNKFLRIAAALLMLCLITTCAIGGTFAKYITTDSKADSARVAKWGVTVQADLSGLFEEGYTATNEATTSQDTASVLTSVQSVNMLAPGTQDSQANALVIAGTPEVKVNITYTCDVELGNWVVDGADYCPLKIVVTIDGVATEFTNVNDVEALEDSIETLITTLSGNINPNTNLAKTIGISWEWAYSVDEATDIKDTALGDAAADGNAATFYIAIGATVTQID